MTRAPLWPWLLLALWSAWLYGASGLVVARSGAGELAAWLPDLGLVLFVALGVRMPAEDLPRIALCVALGRLAVTIDPPAAVLAAFLLAALAVRAVRSVVELRGAVARTVTAGLFAQGLFVWLAFVQDRRAAIEAASRARAIPPEWASDGAWSLAAWSSLPPAVSTALCALVFGGALTRLPGLTPLRERKSWERAVSAL